MAFGAARAAVATVAIAIAVGGVGCATPRAVDARARSARWNASIGQFENPPGWPNRTGGTAFLKWQLGGRPAPTPGFQPPFVKNDGGELRKNQSRPSVTWIGHATLLVQAAGANIVTDPMFSEAVGGLVRRYAPPGVALAALPPIDICTVSHNHRDHLDEESVLALGPSVTYVVPLGLAGWFKARGLTRVIELDWWESTTVKVRSGAEVKVTLVPAQHWSQRGIADHNQSLWGGYVIEAGGLVAYHAGDTGFPADFAEIGRRFPRIDVAMLPIGAYAPRWFLHPQHMAPEQAAEAFRQLGAKTLVPMHWATFHLSDEPMSEPPEVLYRAMGARANRIAFLPIGGTLWLDGTATARR